MKQTVFVTGANKGIGYGIAKHLGLSGWSIVLGARDEQRAELINDGKSHQGGFVELYPIVKED